jgi:hypothetical protein
MVRRNGNGGGDASLYSSFNDIQVRGRLALVKSRRVTDIEMLKPDQLESVSPHSAAASRA